MNPVQLLIGVAYLFGFFAFILFLVMGTVAFVYAWLSLLLRQSLPFYADLLYLTLVQFSNINLVYVPILSLLFCVLKIKNVRHTEKIVAIIGSALSLAIVAIYHWYDLLHPFQKDLTFLLVIRLLLGTIITAYIMSKMNWDS